MEMPIQIIVVLFVALVVGGAILAFSSDVLGGAGDQLNNRFKNDPDNKDVVIEVAAATDETLITLANECVKRNKGLSPGKTLCFAVFANEFQVNDWTALNGQTLQDGFTLNTQAITVVPTAVRLTFNPEGSVDVTG